MSHQLGPAVGEEAIAALEYGRGRIEHCVRQLDREQIWWRPRPEMNAIGNLVLHVCGNMRQWIIAGIGDRPDTRAREEEFQHRDPLGGDELLSRLADTIAEATTTVRHTPESAWLTQRRIQGSDVTKLHALWHAVTHFQGHVQEIIGLTRQQMGASYQYAWVPQTPEEGAVSDDADRS